MGVRGYSVGWIRDGKPLWQSLGLAGPHPSLRMKIRRGTPADVLRRDRIVATYCHTDGDRPIGWFDSDDTPHFVPFIPNPNCLQNMIFSGQHRFARIGKPMDPYYEQDFTAYYREFISGFSPITHYPDLIEWLKTKLKYTLDKKDEIVKSQDFLDLLLIFCDAFIKGENYDKVKFARTINAYPDSLKRIFGPLFEAIDEATFRDSRFVKKMTMQQRVQKLTELFGDSSVMETDFSSFESHMRGVYAEAVFHWFEHMASGVASPDVIALVKGAMQGVNVCRYKWVEMQVDETLMSGASWTSSGNGVLNLLIMSYLVSRTKYPTLGAVERARWSRENFVGVVEGDDGLCVDVGVSKELIDGMGLDLKFETHPHFGLASFCGCVTDPVTSTVVTDPIRFVRRFFYIDGSLYGARKSKQMAALRMKALSYKYQYANAPIVGPVVDQVLRLTRSVDHRSAHAEERVRMQAERAVELKLWQTPACVQPESREHVQEVFGISVEHQLALEAHDLTRPLDPSLLKIGPNGEDAVQSDDHWAREVMILRPGEALDWQPPPRATRVAMFRSVLSNTREGKSAVAAKIAKNANRPTNYAFDWHAGYSEES